MVRTTLEASETYQRVRVNTTELAYVERGQGEPFIYVHGGMSDLTFLEPELSVFASRFRAITYSRRFAWPNQPIPEGTEDPNQQHADDLAELIRKLDAAPAHLAGISLGGNICMLVARQHPELVRSLILQEPGAFSVVVHMPPRPLDLLQVLLTRPRALKYFGEARYFDQAAAAARKGDIEDAVRITINGVNGFDCYDELPSERKQHLLANSATHKAQLLGKPFAVLTADDARLIRQPTLLVAGARGTPLLRYLIDVLAELMPNSEVAVVPGASHGMNWQNPQALDALMLDFLCRAAC